MADRPGTDEFTRRRNERTLSGLVCGLTPKGELHQDDIDEIERFRRFLDATAHLRTPGRPRTPEQAAERLRIYREHYPEDGTT